MLEIPSGTVFAIAEITPLFQRVTSNLDTQGAAVVSTKKQFILETIPERTVCQERAYTESGQICEADAITEMFRAISITAVVGFLFAENGVHQTGLKRFINGL